MDQISFRGSDTPSPDQNEYLNKPLINLDLENSSKTIKSNEISKINYTINNDLKESGMRLTFKTSDRLKSLRHIKSLNNDLEENSISRLS